jgi:hypothetical protein
MWSEGRGEQQHQHVKFSGQCGGKMGDGDAEVAKHAVRHGCRQMKEHSEEQQ